MATSHSAVSTTFHHRLSSTVNSSSSSRSNLYLNFSPVRIKLLVGVWGLAARYQYFNSVCRLQCNATSKSRTTDYLDVFSKTIIPLTNWNEIVEDDTEEENLKDLKLNKIKELVDSIKSMLESMDDGEISVSAYDTAWVALVEDINGSGAPQFPSSLDWIADNQLPDGSWGDRCIFSAYERIINTLACIIALRTWNIHHQKSEKGMLFIKENIGKLEEENEEHMTIGFEVAFPSLVEIAKNLGIQIFPEESAVLQEIYARRNLKLTRIPKDIMHKIPTTLLHSLEGMKELEWEKLIKLQCKDGSFLFSPSSTAFALIHTHDSNALSYLTNTVHKFNGGVPCVYPVDLFEHIWAVDRLQRLGISRHFQSQIKDCLDYVHKYWREEGICWARNSPVQDIDDTAMGFRLLRLHGYPVSADVFENFKNGEEFFGFNGQSNQAVTGMYNLLRASQIVLPGEKILEDAKKFSYQFLKHKRASNQILDKWIITKDLPGEVSCALDMPWYASLSRVETRYYLEQYGGQDDVWIGKILYRMSKVNNNTYMELAKLDYNNCQAMHLVEWSRIKQWYEECKLGEYGASQESLVLLAYYLASASIYEPEKSKERIAWAKTTTLMETIMSYFGTKNMSIEQRRSFVRDFKKCSNNLHFTYGRYKTGQGLMGVLLDTVYQFSLEALRTHGRDIHRHLTQAWETWMLTWQEEGDVYRGQSELVVRTINLCAGSCSSEEQLLNMMSHPQYHRLSQLTNKICHRLRLFQSHKEYEGESINTENGGINEEEIEADMRELVEAVIYNEDDNVDGNIKQTFLTVAKSFYYTAYCNPHTISLHISKVLFESLF